jgi:hypothetical protein
MDSIPLNAAIRITKAAVVTAIPITEIRVIKWITFFFFFEDRYLRAMKNGTLIRREFYF